MRGAKTGARSISALLLVAGLLLLSAVLVGFFGLGIPGLWPSPERAVPGGPATHVAPDPRGPTHAAQPLVPGRLGHLPDPFGGLVPTGLVHPSSAWLNNSSCDPNWPANTPLGIAPIEATIVWSGNTSGLAPLTISWQITIGSGGIPPYQTVVDIESVPATANSTNSTSQNGSLILTQPGLYYAVAEVVDSTCDATWYAFLAPITVEFPGGINSVQIASNTSGGPAPLAVQYAFNATRLAPNTTVFWESPTLRNGSSWNVTTTYYTAGPENASLCLINSTTGRWLACGASAKVNVTSAVVSTAAAVAAGVEPVNITYWVNITNGSLLPTNWEVYLTLDNGTVLLTHSQNLSTNATERFGCDPNTTTSLPDALGACPWVASWLIVVPGVGTLVATGSIWANVTTAGAPVHWYPTVTYSLGPGNGSAPLNVTLNLTATGAVAPYQYWWAVFGASSAAANRTFYATQQGNGSNWSGAAIAIPIALVRNGLYMVSATIADAKHDLVFLFPPVITAGVPLAHLPLGLHANEKAPSNAVNQSLVRFGANVSGGDGPYTVQWNFGDGTFGSSVAGAAIFHTYRSPGTFDPSVTVTDGTGQSATVHLPPVVVRSGAAPGTGGSGGAGVGSGSPTSGLGAAVLPGGWATDGIVVAAGALLVLAVGGYRLGRRRAAEELVQSLEESSDERSNSP